MSSATPKKPSVQPVASFPMELRQMIMEDGRFVDIPKDLLRQPPPKPSEFLYFQHYYESPPSKFRKDLNGCKTTEDAIDLFATEFENMHALISGYIKSLLAVVAQFDNDLKEVREEQESLRINFHFNRRQLDYEAQILGRLTQGYTLLKEKVDLKISKGASLSKLPVVIKPQNWILNPVEDPPMTPEEKETRDEAAALAMQHKYECSLVEKAEAKGKEKQMVDELAFPQLRSSSSSKKGKGVDRGSHAESSSRTPFEPHVVVTVEKLTEGLETMRETFRRVQAKTERELEAMRFCSTAAKQDITDFWILQDLLTDNTAKVGKEMKHLQRQQAAYTNWAERPIQGNGVPTNASSAANGSSTPPSSVNGSTTAHASSSSSSMPAASSSSSSSSPEAAAPPSANGVPSKTSAPQVVTLGSNPQNAPVLSAGCAYAVCITMEHQKPVDELTHEEAIALLKSLPQRLEFVPQDAIQALETDEEFEKLTEKEAKVTDALDGWTEKFEAGLGVNLHLDSDFVLPIVPEKRTEFYEERVEAAAQPEGGPSNIGAADASSPIRDVRLNGAATGTPSTSRMVDGKTQSQKRPRESATDIDAEEAGRETQPRKQRRVGDA